MAGFVNIDPSDSVPIWKQIEDGIRRLAVSGSSPAGSAVPSVRELARDLRINPATVAKAYSRLTDAGVLVVRRGEGTFFAQRAANEILLDRQHILAEGAMQYAEVASGLGVGRDEAVTELDVAFETMNTKTNGGHR